MIKVYEYQNPRWGAAFKRISKAFHDFSPPNIRWSTYAGNADIILVHVVGGGEVPIMEAALDADKKLMIVQHVYSTGGVYDWASYWNKAVLTVSFHDLKSYFPNLDFNFCHTAWGVDSREFFKVDAARTRKVIGTGYVLDTECLDKLHTACINTNNIMYHTGKDFGLTPNYVHLPWLNDEGFNIMLNSVQYTSCLRDIEGFEMMGVEGLFCGARPIVPDLPTYRWYKNFGIFVDMKQDIVKQLENILSIVPISPGEDEMKEIHRMFSWENIVPEIFSRLV